MTDVQPQQQRTWAKDILSLIVFIACVVLGTILINTFVFRSFTVDGRSMENTLHNGDRLIVNRMPVTAAQIQNKPYVPERGEIIVFKNPLFGNSPEEFLVKRVIAFPGERVVLQDGQYTVYNAGQPAGFNPDSVTTDPIVANTTGSLDVTVPDNSLFVSGDNREDGHSLDSRNGLGYVPFYDVIGPVGLRIFPFTQIRAFSYLSRL